MYIVNGYGKEIINSDFVERFVVVEKGDAALIVASYSTENSRPVTMARYKDLGEAKDALGKLCAALSSATRLFYMPESLLYAEEYIKKDARTKRRGGS